MKKRMVIMLVIVGLLIGGVVGFNFFKGYMMQKYMASSPVPPATVLKLAVKPGQSVRLTSSVAMVLVSTVSEAQLVTEPQLPFTSTQY